MDLIGEKITHKSLGEGIITGIEEKYITVQFKTKISKFKYPNAFENCIVAVKSSIQTEINVLIDEKKKAEEIARQAELEQRQADKHIHSAETKNINIDEMFPEDYHVAYLSKHPILTYKQVEEQFKIRISGFGKGINNTASTVVLISAVRKAGGKFTYHDRWTTEGDFIYSGEGKNGDQSMTKGNLAIKNARANGKQIHLFIKFSPQEYYYQGVYELVDYIYENEKDETGSVRKEYKFKLRKAL